MKDVIIVANSADNPVAEDIAHYLRQYEDYQDLISLKSFLNSEFCPRFISDSVNSKKAVGEKLTGKTIIIVSTSQGVLSRNDLAMRNFLIARAARDNGAERVILVEPDLYYSAQDRGPRKDQGVTDYERTIKDFKKFDGQPFSARLYADLLKSAGVDEVVTVHNHSRSVQNIFMDRFFGHFHNMNPADLYAEYLTNSDVVRNNHLILCAPDKGSLEFVKQVKKGIGREDLPLIRMDKERKGEREVKIHLAPSSDRKLSEIEGEDIAVIDDMVRTGNTIIETCHLLRSANPERIVFIVTHFYSSRECRIILNERVLDEIITTTTIPSILNRDVQGRLRHKMVVLSISRWISNYLIHIIDPKAEELKSPLYSEDMSSKNPRWKGRVGPLFSQD